jgi:hypothetical protein
MSNTLAWPAKDTNDIATTDNGINSLISLKHIKDRFGSRQISVDISDQSKAHTNLEAVFESIDVSLSTLSQC